MAHLLAGRWRVFRSVPIGPPSWTDWIVEPHDDAPHRLTMTSDDGRVVADQSANMFSIAAMQGMVRRIDDEGRLT